MDNRLKVLEGKQNSTRIDDTIETIKNWLPLRTEEDLENFDKMIRGDEGAQKQYVSIKR